MKNLRPLQPATGAEIQRFWTTMWPGDDWYFDDRIDGEFEDSEGEWCLDPTRVYTTDEIDGWCGFIGWQGPGRSPLTGVDMTDWSFGMFICWAQNQVSNQTTRTVILPKDKVSEFEALVASLDGRVL